MSNVLALRDIRKTFYVGFFRKKSEILRGVNLQVEPGEIFGFLGPNGAGKTTTIKILMGLIFPTSGDVKVLGHSPTETNFRQRIGFLPDNPYFYSYLTGEEFLDFYARLFGFRKAERVRKINRLLELVDMEKARSLALNKYSKGMLQRIGMAQSLLNDPELAIMDEPMTGLDPVGRKDIRDIILRLRSEKKTVFFSTHILSDVELICDRVAIMVRGEIRGQGTLTELLGKNIRGVEVCVSHLESSALEEMQKKFGVVRSQSGQALFTIEEGQTEGLLQEVLLKKGKVVSVTPHRESLERLFLSEIR